MLKFDKKILKEKKFVRENQASLKIFGNDFFGK
jgi:hypothetical protein